MEKSSTDEKEYKLPFEEIQQGMRSIMEERGREKGICIEELWMGTQLHRIAKVRSNIAWQLEGGIGLPLAEIAR